MDRTFFVTSVTANVELYSNAMQPPIGSSMFSNITAARGNIFFMIS